jgi:hypothetical protein
MSYNYRLPLSKDPAKKKHKKAIAFLSLMLVVIICAVAVFAWYISQAGNTDQPQSDIRSDNFNPLKTFETPDFTFQTDKSWSYIKDESSANKFVYRSSKKNVVMRDMTVYVNSLPPNLLLTYVLPVEPAGDKFAPGDISNHCKSYLKNKIKLGDNNPVEATIESVRIKCQVDGTSATVGTGLVNGSYQTELTGKSGKKNRYYLLYHDLQYSPDLDTFTAIVRSFRSK